LITDNVVHARATAVHPGCAVTNTVSNICAARDGIARDEGGGNARNNNNATGALPNAPLAGHWFQTQFDELLRNAFPPL